MVPPSLVKHIWQFCNKHNILIEEETTSNVILRRENERFQMEDIALLNEQFTNNEELSHINHYHIYLQVTTLVDITTGNGMLIRQGILKGNAKLLNEPYYKWPYQPRPGIFSWRLWRKAIKLCFMRGVGLHLQPGFNLGQWNDGEQDKWKWFFHQKLYHRGLNRWKVYRRQGRGCLGTQSPFVYMNDAFSKPAQAIRCTVHEDITG